MTYAVIPDNKAAYRHPTGLGLSAAASNVAVHQRPTAMPASIPADQLYYWSSLWQGFEQESRADLAAGRSETFGNPDDAVRHLLSAE